MPKTRTLTREATVPHPVPLSRLMDDYDVQVKVLEGKLKLYTYPYPFQSEVKNAILFCHGGIEGDSLSSLTMRTLLNRGSPRFTVPPWTFLCFYAPHDSLLQWSIGDEPRVLTEFMTNVNTPFEIIPPQASSYDYLLQPWKSDEFAKNEDQIKRALAMTRLGGIFEKPPAVLFDFITLNPSWMFPTRSATLKEVLDILAKTGHLYSKIHYFSCRYVFDRRVEDSQLYLPVRPFNKDIAPIPQ